MTPLIKAAGFDMTQYPAKLVDTMKDGQTGALLGIPYAVYPSYIFFNKDLFDEAGLEYPPQKVGDKYTMPDGSQVDWTWDTVRKIAMLLSVDKNGKDATQAGFDPANQTQFGFEFQWTEGRRLASAFGSGSLVAADGKTAQFPDVWKAGWKWYYDGIWKDHFIANDTERNSDLLAKGNSPLVRPCRHGPHVPVVHLLHVGRRDQGQAPSRSGTSPSCRPTAPARPPPRSTSTPSPSARTRRSRIGPSRP